MIQKNFGGVLLMYGVVLADIKNFYDVVEKQTLYFLTERNMKLSGMTTLIIALAGVLSSTDWEDNLHLQEKIKQAYIFWGEKAMHFDFFDANFESWLKDKNHLPSEIQGNAAAARAVIIPYLCNDLDRVKEIAKLTAEITCANPSDIFNAEFAAAAVYTAMWYPNKSSVKTSLEYLFGSEITEDTANKNIVAEAVLDFYNATDIFSAIDNSIKRGGDTKSRAAISGSMAEVFFGLPFIARSQCNTELNGAFSEIFEKFDRLVRNNILRTDAETSYSAQCLTKAVNRFNENHTAENFSALMKEIYLCIQEGVEVTIPLIVHDRNKMYAESELPEETEYLTLDTKEGKNFVAVFVETDENFSEHYPDSYLGSIENIFNEIVEGKVEADGIVFDLKVFLDKDDLKEILNISAPVNEMFFYDGHYSELNISALVTSRHKGFENISPETPHAVIYSHFMKEVPDRDDKYIIYTPLAFYDGGSEEAIFDCYQACLNLAKKCHVTEIAFSPEVVFAGGIPLLNAAVNAWFKHNQTYGMKIFVATGEKKTSDNDGGEFFKVNFITEKNNSAQGNFDYTKGKAVSTSKEAKQKAVDFKNKFANIEDFYTALKNFGFKWKAENSDSEQIKTMWAINSLARAIEEQNFNPFDSFEEN